MSIDGLDFTEKYTGLMSDEEIALELKTDLSEIRKIRREFSQLCWSCKNACDENKCDWVKTNIYPQWVEVDYEGRIVECDRYEYDGKIHD